MVMSQSGTEMKFKEVLLQLFALRVFQNFASAPEMLNMELKFFSLNYSKV